MIRVMVVEDDPMVMDITCKYAGSIAGFTVCAKASSAAEAYRRLEKTGIDLLVLDIHMPVMNGIEFLKSVREKQLGVDVLFLTADSNVSVINDALKLGAVDYLIKPFNYERFKASLENYSARYRLLHEAERATQEQLDALLGASAASGGGMRKGLHPRTLESFRQYIRSSPRKMITQTEIAQALGLSKVTVRRYMEYLASANEVLLHIEYGAVGRPTYNYKILV